ncbi:MAG: V-type ATP synthase subunit F [Oscillospiraceae bacterium]
MKFFLISDNNDALMGMRLAGIEGTHAKTVKKAEEAIKKAVESDDIAILLITAGIEKLCPEIINELKQGNKPLLVEIPDGEGNGRDKNSITNYIRDAVGIKI